MLMNAERCCLLLVDLQVRLAPAIAGMDDILNANLWLLEIARRLSVPVAATVQYPSGLGPLLPEVAARVDPGSVAEKIHFSATRSEAFARLAAVSRSQVVLTGTEAHICVLQTALDLRSMGKEVFVVADAVGSRRESDKALALERLRQAGCVVVSREMVAYEWLERAGTECFREIHREFLR